MAPGCEHGERPKALDALKLHLHMTALEVKETRSHWLFGGTLLPAALAGSVFSVAFMVDLDAMVRVAWA